MLKTHKIQKEITTHVNQTFETMPTEHIQNYAYKLYINFIFQEQEAFTRDPEPK